MGHKPSAPKYNVEYRSTDYIRTPYNVDNPRYVNTPSAMQVPEYDTNVALAEQNRLNSAYATQQYANLNSPMGGYSISVDPTTGQMTVNKALSDNSTLALNNQQQVLDNYTGDPTTGANAYYNAQMAYLQPQLQRQTTRSESALTNRGIPIGGSAWNEYMGDVYDTQNQQMANLGNAALTAGQSYQGNILNQGRLLGGQVVDPTMIYGQGGAGLSDMYANQYNIANAQAQANYDNAVLRYNNEYQDAMNQYQNNLNAYNAALANNQGTYQANLENNQGLWQNDVNKYNQDVNVYKTKMAKYNAKQQAWVNGLNPLGAVAGSYIGGNNTAGGFGTAVSAQKTSNPYYDGAIDYGQAMSAANMIK